MADVSSKQVACTTTAALLVQADTDGCRLVVHKQGSGFVYLGGSDVSSSNGFGLDNGAGPVEILLAPNATLYGRTSTGTETIQILILGNV